MATKIEWATETWNPITGCTPISEGCKNCYAQRMAQRLKGRFGYDKDDPFKPTLHAEKMDLLYKWKKKRRVFVSSMGDIFHESVPDQWIVSVFDIMHQLPQHTFMILTKRPQRMYEFIGGDCMTFWDARYNTKEPLPNVWVGVTAENQARANERIPILLDTPATVRFLSIEPMLGSIDLDAYIHDLDWIICGSETGAGARLMNPVWARDLRLQCDEAHKLFFFKKAAPGIQTLDGKVIREIPE